MIIFDFQETEPEDEIVMVEELLADMRILQNEAKDMTMTLSRVGKPT